MPKIALAAAALSMLVAVAGAEQPNMRDALQELRKARQSLEKAAADKGGHRERAIDFVDKAIAAVQDGIAFADKKR